MTTTTRFVVGELVYEPQQRLDLDPVAARSANARWTIRHSPMSDAFFPASSRHGAYVKAGVGTITMTGPPIHASPDELAAQGDDYAGHGARAAVQPWPLRPVRPTLGQAKPSWRPAINSSTSGIRRAERVPRQTNCHNDDHECGHRRRRPDRSASERLAADVHPVDLSATVLERLGAAPIRPATIDDVVWVAKRPARSATSRAASDARRPRRIGRRRSGPPSSTGGGSAQQAVHLAAGVISGQYEVAIAGGVESSVAGPGWARRAPPGCSYPPSVLEPVRRRHRSTRGVGAEMIASRWGMSRTQVDEYSARSHERTAAAADAGAFDSQLVETQRTRLRRGAAPHHGRDAAGRPRSTNGVITAGNSSRISDSAPGLLIQETPSTPSSRAGRRSRGSTPRSSPPITPSSADRPDPRERRRHCNLRTVDHADIGAFRVNEAFAPRAHGLSGPRPARAMAC